MIKDGVILFASCFNLTAQGPDYSRGNGFLGIFGMSLTRKLVDVPGGPPHKGFPLKPRGAAYTSEPFKASVSAVHAHEALLRKSQEVLKGPTTVFS